MGLERIHSFLAHPAKGLENKPQIGGTNVPRQGKLGEMLSRTFDRAPIECDIDIVFRPDGEGRQQNSCRDDLVAYITRPTLANGRVIASRLQDVTTHRSGLGLVFLMTGDENGQARLVVSRFPADQGIIAEEDREHLSVEFIERVFMKSAKAYKSVFYQSDSASRGFWDGRAVDRQVSGPKELSDYWIRDFLDSELRTTASAGTKRVAVALRGAIRTADALDVRQELVAAATLLRGRDGQVASGRQMVEGLSLSDAATAALEEQLPRPELMDEAFQFDREEFDRHLLYRVVQLDNGGMLLAEDSSFEEVFERELIDAEVGVIRFSTEGRVVDEQLRRTR